MRRPVGVAVLLLCAGGGLATGCERPASRDRMTAAEALPRIADLAARGCACETDKSCMREIRAAFDEVKRELLEARLTEEERATFDRELGRLRMCGDAAGTTIWLGNQ